MKVTKLIEEGEDSKSRTEEKELTKSHSREELHTTMPSKEMMLQSSRNGYARNLPGEGSVSQILDKKFSSVLEEQGAGCKTFWTDSWNGFWC